MLNIDDLVSTLLLEEMKWKTMDGQTEDALSVRGQSTNINKIYLLGAYVNLKLGLDLQDNM